MPVVRVRASSVSFRKEYAWPAKITYSTHTHTRDAVTAYTPAPKQECAGNIYSKSNHTPRDDGGDIDDDDVHARSENT